MPRSPKHSKALYSNRSVAQHQWQERCCRPLCQRHCLKSEHHQKSFLYRFLNHSPELDSFWHATCNIAVSATHQMRSSLMCDLNEVVVQIPPGGWIVLFEAPCFCGLLVALDIQEVGSTFLLKSRWFAQPWFQILGLFQWHALLQRHAAKCQSDDGQANHGALGTQGWFRCRFLQAVC